MRWLVDECVDAALVQQLRASGHDACYVAESGSGATDFDILHQAHQEDRVLLTEDKDFGELVFRARKPVPGIVLLRISPENRDQKWPRLKAAMAQFHLRGRFIVVEGTRMRSRPLLMSV